MKVGISSLVRGRGEGVDSGPERLVDQALFDQRQVVREVGVFVRRDASGEGRESRERWRCRVSVQERKLLGGERRRDVIVDRCRRIGIGVFRGRFSSFNVLCDC